jgi:hypothetical protein
LTFFWQHEEALCFLQLNNKRMEKGKKHIFLSEWILITFFCPKVVHFFIKIKNNYFARKQIQFYVYFFVLRRVKLWSSLTLITHYCLGELKVAN